MTTALMRRGASEPPHPATLRRTCAGVLMLVIGIGAAPAWSQDATLPVDRAEIVGAAGTMSALGERTGDPDLLLSAAALLLLTGAGLSVDDPWNARRLLERAAAGDAAGAYADQAARLGAASRGIVSGPSRQEVILPPGGEAAFELTVVGGEYAIAEARLRQGSDGADIDLVVHNAAGDVLGSDLGRSTGIVGFGAYVEWLPPSCQRVQATIRNVGTAGASVVFLAPPAQEQSCGK